MDTHDVVGTRVLIVDDERALRMLVTMELEGEGYQVKTAEDGDEALAILLKEAFDLVILDIRMPRMNGLSVLREMKSKDIRPRVVVLTGVDDLEIAIQAMRLGANDYVTRPFDSGTLLASIRCVLTV